MVNSALLGSGRSAAAALARGPLFLVDFKTSFKTSKH